MALITVELFWYVVRTNQVNANVLGAALCVYLLLGTVFAFLYAVVETLAPDSFVFPSEAGASRSMSGIGDYFYFSLVTMTTTGFGDIRPVAQIARGLTMIEILLGQLYLVVMISRLVSLWGQASPSR